MPRSLAVGWDKAVDRYATTLWEWISGCSWKGSLCEPLEGSKRWSGGECQGPTPCVTHRHRDTLSNGDSMCASMCILTQLDETATIGSMARKRGVWPAIMMPSFVVRAVSAASAGQRSPKAPPSLFLSINVRCKKASGLSGIAGCVGIYVRWAPRTSSCRPRSAGGYAFGQRVEQRPTRRFPPSNLIKYCLAVRRVR